MTDTQIDLYDAPYDLWIVPKPPDPVFVALTRLNLAEAHMGAQELWDEIPASERIIPYARHIKAEKLKLKTIPQQAPVQIRFSRPPILRIYKKQNRNCSGCGCDLDELNPKCKNCKSRHAQRKIDARNRRQVKSRIARRKRLKGQSSRPLRTLVAFEFDARFEKLWQESYAAYTARYGPSRPKLDDPE